MPRVKETKSYGGIETIEYWYLRRSFFGLPVTCRFIFKKSQEVGQTSNLLPLNHSLHQPKTTSTTTQWLFTPLFEDFKNAHFPYLRTAILPGPKPHLWPAKTSRIPSSQVFERKKPWRWERPPSGWFWFRFKLGEKPLGILSFEQSKTLLPSNYLLLPLSCQAGRWIRSNFEHKDPPGRQTLYIAKYPETNKKHKHIALPIPKNTPKTRIARRNHLHHARFLWDLLVFKANKNMMFKESPI